MHPRRPDIEAALTDLRTRLPGGKIVDHWGGEPHWPTPEQTRLRDKWLDSMAEALEAALTRQAFEPITIFEARSPPDWEFIVAHALARHGGRVASFPAFSETRQRDGDTFITLGTASDEMVIYQGPLELHGHVHLSGTVVVLGDLIIHGALMDGDPADSGLVVIGNERVRALYTSSDHLMVGDLETDLLYLSGGEGSWVVGGEVRASLQLEEARASEEARRWLEPVPSDEVLEDGWALCREVGSGRTKVRPPP
ncbi:hypothetical protein D7Y27_24770 [Corallococcus sp. AB004]|uniref:hypothetical protein n=1 Tax=Corallococcus exiguus TaxID=83462 RepID=UPI000EA04DB0|nr:hypothetical protein [Corallococcus exiguus]NPC70221.1 hypothetical protein [Corallococcus exiguus]NPD24304.1 hypothetical protein [Corallococcus exiguus]NRD44891.1 hypothetical protein [Corallococcus exiguus]RKI37855.1 hypothetical protein D7Y27_24770 [Corallococcus sp. AB004]